MIAVEPGERRKELARALGASEVLDPADLEVFPAVGARADLPARPPTWFSSARARRRPWRPGSTSCARGGTLALVGAGIEHPTFDPNRFILNELKVVGSFVYDQGGFEQALDLLASDGFPTEQLIEAEDVPLDRHLGRAGGLGRGPLCRQGDGGPPPVRGAEAIPVGGT